MGQAENDMLSDVEVISLAVVSGALTQTGEQKIRNVLKHEFQHTYFDLDTARYFEWRCLSLDSCIAAVIKALSVMYRQYASLHSLAKAGLPVVCNHIPECNMAEPHRGFCWNSVAL